MPVAFSCSPQRVLVLMMCCQNCPFSFTLKTLKTGIRFKIWSLIGQHLEICVCPCEPARTFCCHFMRFFHWLIGPKLICVNDFVFNIFVLSPCLLTSITCVFSESDVWWWCGCGLGVVLGSTGSCSVIWLLESCCLGCMSSVSFLWCWCRSLFGVLSLRVGHALLFVSVPLLSFVSLSPPSWWTISVVDFVSLVERGPIGREVVVSSSGSSSSVVSSKVTCVPCLFVQFLFYFISCLVIPARTDLLEAGSAGYALNDVGVESSIIYQVCLLV
jgi:hypothetical protein